MNAFDGIVAQFEQKGKEKLRWLSTAEYAETTKAIVAILT